MSHNPASDTKTAPWKAHGINLTHNLEKLAQAAAGAGSGMAQAPETLPAASNGIRHHAARLRRTVTQSKQPRLAHA